VRIHIEGRDRLPPGPAIYCFNHLGWVDPFVLMAVLPMRPRLFFFGPSEADMRVGARNRVMAWTGTPIPFRPDKDDLLRATRHVQAVLAGGAVMAIAGEGRIHASESELWPLNDGPAYFALRASVPIVPVAINGTSWLHFRARVSVRVGEPLAAGGRPDRETVDALTRRTWAALHAMVRDAPDVPEPGPFGRWLTERFNDWPEGSREATRAAGSAHGPGGD
jgi:1-acyl-sn-glycerol-3-phosphate acyltransferase